MNRSKQSAHVAIAFAKRLIALTFPMLLAVASLAILEGIVLWVTGFTYVPRSRITSIGVLDVCLAGESRWAISRIFYRQSGNNQSCLWDILLHDMQRPELVRTLNTSDFDPQVVSASSDGRRFAIGGLNGTVHVWDDLHRPSQPRVIHDATGDILTALSCSPNGEFLFAAGQSLLYGWQIATGKLIYRIEHGCGSGRCSISFSNDSTKIMFVGCNSRVLVFDIDRGRLVDDIVLQTSSIFSASLSPDGKLVGAVTMAGVVTVVELESSSELWRSQVGQAAPIAFSSDGKRIAVVHRPVDRQFLMQIREARTGDIIQQFAAHNCMVPGLFFAPDDSLISWDLEGHIRQWDVNAERTRWTFSAREWVSESKSLVRELGL